MNKIVRVEKFGFQWYDENKLLASLYNGCDLEIDFEGINESSRFVISTCLKSAVDADDFHGLIHDHILALPSVVKYRVVREGFHTLLQEAKGEKCFRSESYDYY